jgi:putative spermidine/putrescine transport system ATP-binding protein
VRTDRIQVRNQEPVAALDAQHSVRAVVSDVEYQGSYVLLGLHLHGVTRDAHATADLSVMLPETDYAAQPRALGDTVDLHWGAHDVHVLAA